MSMKHPALPLVPLTFARSISTLSLHAIARSITVDCLFWIPWTTVLSPPSLRVRYVIVHDLLRPSPCRTGTIHDLLTI